MSASATDPHAAPLTPGDASAALLMVEDRYLLQLRDPDRPIFFPGYWGTFGGGIEAGETAETAILRELQEELALDVMAKQLRYFTHFTFDFAFSGSPTLSRVYYEIELPNDILPQLHLQEGREMRLFSPQELFAETRAIRLTPYDDFALWMHFNRKRLMPARRTLGVVA